VMHVPKKCAAVFGQEHAWFVMHVPKKCAAVFG
jgi:hypothetical protein